jgi:hypothetical protein
MNKNEGNVDRVVRVIFGVGLLSLVFIGPQTTLGYIGIIPLITGLVGWCPIYKIFRYTTFPFKKT